MAAGQATGRATTVAPRASRSWRSSRGLGWLLVGLPTCIALAGAWAYRWVDEDAFINFRIIANLLGGRGFVYNPGERVEADSDPLWVLTLAGLHVFTPFLSLEWLSVVLGLALTTTAFLVGGRAAWVLLGGRTREVVVPIGMLVVAVVPAIWEFSTSGLEMSMVFLWYASAFALSVASLERPGRLWPAALVVGLGTLIRPELALPTVVLLAAILVLAATTPGHRASWRRLLALVGCAAAIPVAFEVFRMAYYALLVPNTALAKDAGAQWWSQGWVYLCNLLVPYALWFPLLIGGALLVVVARSLVVGGERRRALVLVAPAVAGLVDALWVTSIGGDYMHGRLLLPGLFACCLSLCVPRRLLRGVATLAVAAIVAWAGLCATVLRFHATTPAHLGLQTIFISDERDSWITATKVAHPITAADYAAALSGRAGRALRAEAAATPTGVQRLAVIENPFAPVARAPRGRARSALTFSLAANVPGIGVVGYVSGPKVYIFDEFSLANPIGSHTTITHHARPGHEKLIGPAWMLGRFLAPGAAVPGGVPGVEVAAARRAISCGGLATYLHAITGPVTWSGAWHNVLGAFGWTTMRFSADPIVAARQLCGPGR